MATNKFLIFQSPGAKMDGLTPCICKRQQKRSEKSHIWQSVVNRQWVRCKIKDGETVCDETYPIVFSENIFAVFATDFDTTLKYGNPELTLAWSKSETTLNKFRIMSTDNKTGALSTLIVGK